MSAGAAGGAAAAAAAKRMRDQEEEEMTPYEPHDLNEGWEFKILRSGLGAFRKLEKLQAVLDEEAQAGWTLVEKFDDNRIRLKRPVTYRPLDAKLDFDAYRTVVGHTDGRIAAVIVGAVLLALMMFFLIATK